MRLDKFLADAGKGTRAEVKGLIRRGLVLVNGEQARKPEQKIEPERDEILCEGERLSYQKNHYYMLHKPAGVVSATEDGYCKTVLDILEAPVKKNLFPVGRLDKDTEGLLLLTDDGALAHQLLSPKKQIGKVYYAKVKGQVGKEDIKAFQEGLSLGDFVTLPAELTILKADEISEIELLIYEGKFHQVKRMFEAVGKEVIYLKRLSMGSLCLDQTLAPGESRPLTKEEIEKLKNGSSYVRECKSSDF